MSQPTFGELPDDKKKGNEKRHIKDSSAGLSKPFNVPTAEKTKEKDGDIESHSIDVVINVTKQATKEKEDK